MSKKEYKKALTKKYRDKVSEVDEKVLVGKGDRHTYLAAACCSKSSDNIFCRISVPVPLSPPRAALLAS